MICYSVHSVDKLSLKDKLRYLESNAISTNRPYAGYILKRSAADNIVAFRKKSY